MTTHDDLCAIPTRVTSLEESVARLDLWVTELLKQTAQLRQQQIIGTRPDSIPRLGYTITETAAALNLTRTQVYELIAAGRLHPIAIGPKGQRIPADQLDRLLHPVTAIRVITKGDPDAVTKAIAAIPPERRPI